MPSTASDRLARLDHYYQQVQAVILARQNPISGLLPASTAINSHGNYTDAWVRDNVYSILAVWGLALAYRNLDKDSGRTFELKQSVVKLMRGLLYAMMRQAPKVERFKETQALDDALHAKYNTHTGEPVVGDDEWGHLQLDATSLFLLMLAQMTASGLHIVYTIDEVNFVQNLVYYIGRAYRTPDYGIWERGNKINHGNAELNASSVGIAKAALEAIDGLNLFGVLGSQPSVIHVLGDEIARARITLGSLLPRESSSKEVDAALLSVISFPAFAIEDEALIERTRTKILDKLAGRYGCKRFLRDGHQTVLEDTSRLHYEPEELRQFEHIECEWPLFFTYLRLDALFRGDRALAADYKQRLEGLCVEQNGIQLLPELYYVPADRVDAERRSPHSQTRLPNDNIPLVWAQSLYWLGDLLEEGLIAIGDIDPLGRHLHPGRQRHPIVQVALLAEDSELQEKLADYGIATQTPQEVEPIQVRRAEELAHAYAHVGRNDKINLSGRPIRRLRSLTTSKVFRIQGNTLVFLPAFLDQTQFYLTLDYHFLVAQVRSELAYIQRHWQRNGRPTMVLMLTHTMLETAQAALLELMQDLQNGHCNGVEVLLGPLNQLLLTAGSERIDFLHDFQFSQTSLQNAQPRHYYLSFDPAKTGVLSYTQEFSLECETNPTLLIDSLRQSVNLYEQTELLQTLVRLKGLSFETGLGGPDKAVTVADLLEEVYSRASKQRLWGVVRRTAGLVGKLDISLSDTVTDILVRQKQIAVGKSYSEASLITKPMSNTEILAKIEEFCGEDIRDRVLTQEILTYLGVLIKAEPDLFKGFLTLRVGYLVLLIVAELARDRQLTQDEAYEQLMELSPFEVKTHLRRVLAGYETMNQTLRQQESLHVSQEGQSIDWAVLPEDQEPATPAEGWAQRRHLDGALNRVPKDFYPGVWRVLRHCRGLVIGDKLERRNRLESHIVLSEMTPGEKNFALRVEHLLNKIAAPEYRQVNVEALMELSAILEHNPTLRVEDYIVLDVLIGHAVRLAWLADHPEHENHYDQHKAAAWQTFYRTSPYRCAGFIAKAMQFLSQQGSTSVVTEEAIAR